MRKILLRWRVWTAWAAAAISLYAIVGFFVVPRIARAQIVKQSRALLHREASVSRVRFNPFTLAAVVEQLELKDRDGADLFRLDRLSINFQISGLFRRSFRFREIVLEKPQVVARIAADGRMSIADLFEKKAAEKPEGEKSSLPRVFIDRFTMRSGAAKFVDESKAPAFVLPIAPLNLELHELSTIPDESGDHSIALGLEGGAQIRWSGRQTVEPLRLQGRIDVTAARLPRFWEYFASAIPLEMRDGKLDVSCSYEIRSEQDGAPEVDVNDIKVAVRQLALRPRGGDDADWLVVPELDATGARVQWPESRAEIREVRVKGLQALAFLDANGINWKAAVPTNVAAPEPSAGTNAPKPWTAKVGVVELLGGSVRFEDRTHEPSIVTDVADLGLTLENVTTDLQAPVPTKLKARVNDGGELEVSGTIAPGPPSIDLAVALRGIDLRPYVPYAMRLPGLDLRSGVASTSGKVRVGPGPPKIQFDGGLELADLEVAGGGSDRLLACRRITVRGARVSVAPEKVRIAAIDVDGAFAKVEIDRQGRVNIKEILAGETAATAPPAPPPPAPPAPPAKGEPLDLGIGTIAIRDASAEYTDLSVILPFGTKIHAINGSLKDLAMNTPVPAALALEGRISETGYFKADGTMRIAKPFAATDILLIFRGVTMSELTPYSAQFAGYSITSGVLDVDVRYGIKDGRLVGDHRVIAKDMVLGPKVEGAKGPGVPVRLAVALLKDKDGRIDLEVPVEGTIDSPEFNYKSVMWQAVKTILGNVAKAPFRAIGRLFGADSEDLELVGFVPGHSELPAPEQDKLVKLSAELAAKAELSIEIEGRFDPVKDVEAIRRIRLDEQIDARRAGAPSVEAIVQSLYAESFTTERLEAERQKFPPEDAAGLYDALRAQLLEAQDVPQSVLQDLARARATAIAAALTAPGGLDAARVKIVDPAPVKRKKQGSELVASEMSLSAGD